VDSTKTPSIANRTKQYEAAIMSGGYLLVTLPRTSAAGPTLLQLKISHISTVIHLFQAYAWVSYLVKHTQTCTAQNKQLNANQQSMKRTKLATYC